MLYVDHWWVILQLGLAVFASARGWGFTPWGLFIAGFLFTGFLASTSPALLFFAGVAWPDMVLTLILFFMVANGSNEEHAPFQTEPLVTKLRTTMREQSASQVFKPLAADADAWEPAKRSPGLLWESSANRDPFARRP